MANVFVTNTARFNPFSYQELATPLIQATQQHMALDEALSSLDDGTLATYLAGEDENSPYVVGYNNLTKRIETLGRQLATEGLNPAMVRDALKLKGDYKRFSTPVETAGKRRQQLSDEYRKLQLTVPYLIGENPSEKSLQFYIDNPNYTPEYDNGEAYINQGTLIGKQLADQLRNPDAPYTAVPGSGGAFIRAVYRRGYTPEEIANDPMFVNITNQIMQSRGVDPSGNDARTNAIRSYIQQGLFSSLGKDEVDMRNNPNHLNPLQQLQYNALKNPPKEEDYGSMLGADRYVGKEHGFVDKLFGKNGIIKTFEYGSVTDKNGVAFNNSLEVKNYLDALRSQATSYIPANGYGANPANIQKLVNDEDYQKAMKQYRDELRRLEKYSISDSDYRNIVKTLGFTDNKFTIDDIESLIANQPERFGSGLIPVFELANQVTSDKLLDTYMNHINQSITSYIQGNENTKGQFYWTDKVNLDTSKPLDAKDVQKILGDSNTKIYGLNLTKQLLLNDEGRKPYAYISTSKGNIAVPVSFLESAGISLAALAASGYLDGDPSSFFVNDATTLGTIDDTVAASNAANVERQVMEVTPSKGKNPNR